MLAGIFILTFVSHINMKQGGRLKFRTISQDGQQNGYPNSSKTFLDIYGCIFPNFSSLNKNISISQFLWVRNLGVDQFGYWSSQFLMKLQSRCQLGLQSSEVLNGAGGFKVGHSYTCQVNAGCFQDAIVPCHKNTSIRILEVPAGVAAGFLQNK